MADTITKKIAVITGSTRAVRIGPQVAKFVTEILEANLSNEISGKEVKFTLSQVDIAAFKLPVFDEAVVPAMVPMFAQFEQEHSKVWSAEIAKYDGYVRIPFPQLPHVRYIRLILRHQTPLSQVASISNANWR